MKRNWIKFAATTGMWSALALVFVAPAAADLKLAMVASPDPVRPGELLTFHLTVTNAGSSSVSNVALQSVQPSGTSGVIASDGGGCTSGCAVGRIVNWALGSLPAGASRTVEMTMFASSGATDEISTSASVAGDAVAGDQVVESVAVAAIPLLALVMRADRDPVGVGELLAYTVTFANRGAMALNNVTLTAQLPVGAVLQSASDQGSADGSTVTWTLGSVPARQSGERRFTVQVPAAATNGDILRSEAEISDADTEASARATSATSVRTNAPMAVALSTSPDPVRPGALLSYQLTVTNRGPSTLNNVALRSIQPGGTSGVSASDGGGCTSGCDVGRIVNWTLGSMAVGTSRTVTMTVDASSGSTDGAPIFNRAWAVADGGASASAEQTVMVSTAPLLALALLADRDPVGAGEMLAYTVTFANRSAMALNSVTLTAQLPVGAVLQSASDQGSADGSTVTWTLGSVPARQSGQRRFTVQVPAAATNGDIVRSQAEIHDTDTGGSARATSAATVRTNAPLAVAMTASYDPVRPGALLSYQLTVTNRGPSTLNNVALRSIQPGGTSGVSASDGGGCTSGCDVGRIVNWTLGSMATGNSRTVTMTLDISSDSTDGTPIFNRAWAVADGGASASAEQTVMVSTAPLLALALLADHDPVGAGELLAYTLTFANRSAMVLNDVTLTAQLPVGTVLQDLSDQGVANDGNITWGLGRVGVGQGGERRFVVRAPAAAANGDILRSDAAIHDADSGGSARATSATTVQTNARIALASSASPDPVRPGAVLSYQIQVTNLGAGALNNIVLRGIQPGGTSGVNASDGGGCTSGCAVGRTVNWSLGTLAAGGSRTVTMTVAVSAGSTDGALIFNRFWVLADDGAAASMETSTRVCAAGGTACDHRLSTPTFTSTATGIATPTATPPTPATSGPATSTPTRTATPSPTATATLAATPCAGDCNGGGSVTVDEILAMVNIALGNANVSACLAGDANDDNQITVDEILAAVNNALNGCTATGFAATLDERFVRPPSDTGVTIEHATTTGRPTTLSR